MTTALSGSPAPPALPELQLHRVTDALVVPTPRTWPVGVVFGGVFDAAGAPIADSLLYRNYSQVVFAPDTAPEPSETVTEPHLFGGYCIDHFGHFLLEGLARSWATAQHPDLPVAWATPGQATGWQTDICAQLGFAQRMRFVDRPTRFKELFIPAPGYRITDLFHPRHAAFLGCAEPAAPVEAHRLVWLSRQGISGAGSIGGEDQLEALLQAQGWSVIRPETLSIEAQLGVLSHAHIVAGVEGSALHLPILLKHPPKAMVVLRRLDNQNYQTIATGRDMRMYDVVGSLQHAPDPTGRVQHLLNPQATADVLNQIAEPETEGTHPDTHDRHALTYYQSDAPRFAPHRAMRAAPPSRSLARRIARKLLRR